MHRRFRFRAAWLLLWAVTSIGCNSKMIQNLGAIDADTTFRADGIIVRIFLLTDEGKRLYWEQGILNPVSGGVLPPEDLDTQVKVWSLRAGQRHKEIYSGRLQGLQWNIGYVNSYRALVGRVPRFAMESDPEADSAFGDMKIVLKTPKQGEFETELFGIQVFPTTLFSQSNSSIEGN